MERMPMHTNNSDRRLGFWAIVMVASLILQAEYSRADEISGESNGKKTEKAGTVKFENDEILILESSDGKWTRIAKKDIKEQTKKPAPPRLKLDELGKEIQEELKAYPHLRIKVTPEVIAVLILETELEKEHEDRADKVLTQITKTYCQAATAVQQFAKKLRLPQKKTAYPAVVLLCESQAVADQRQEVQDQLQGVGFLTSNGWYDPSTNWATFSLPEILGERGTMADVLIWQQLFHTGLLQRQAPVPLWFLQGVATGFDWTQNKIDPNHHKLSSVTFPGLQEAEPVDWDKMANDYTYYENGELSFDDFRDQAWGLHWYLMNKNKAAYTKYWKTMSDLSPLDSYVTEKSQADFKKAFGKNPDAFKTLFAKAFQTASQQPPPPLEPEDTFIYLKEEQGSIKMTWLDEAIQNNEVRMDGKLTNISPLRARSFIVGFSTNRGKSAVWFVDKLEPSKSVELKAQRAVEPPEDKAEKKDKAAKKPAPEGEHEVDNYWIKSVLPDSPQAEKWRKGELPLTPGED